MEIKNITYSYHDKKNVLENVNAGIELGKITTIIGPNGSGKSTLLGIMAKHYTPRKGNVILDGKGLSAYKSKELAKKIAIVNQQNSAPNDLTVEKLVSYGRLPYKTIFSSDKDADKEAIEWVLSETNIQHKRHETIDQLSGGERQRVWIAMSLAQQTPFLFLDEPTTYLDIYYQYEVLDLINRLNKEYEMTIVMVLHDINQAIRYSDKIIVMKNGTVFVHGDPDTIITVDLMKEVYGIDMMIKNEKDTGLYTIPIGI
ncbi:ABC transporter ATP-binding protein [Pseudogracilibacillus sp. SE30717A]|uniref:ABC transporter ATP-binding protein n=1 Tax=Pseudogracilibacillus sp. SE30717A TaxID=3098293 RepID=UPI00300E4948